MLWALKYAKLQPPPVAEVDLPHTFLGDMISLHAWVHWRVASVISR